MKNVLVFGANRLTDTDKYSIFAVNREGSRSANIGKFCA